MLSQIKRRWARGSSVIEVLMAITLVAVGASGVMAMQKVTISANRNAKDLEVANEIGRTWMERLRIDSMKWNNSDDSDLLTDTIWIGGNVTDPGTHTWFRPEYTGPRFPAMHGMHNALGKDWSASPEEHPFCVNVRLGWLEASVPKNVVRAEVRVFWLRQGTGGWSGAPNVQTYLTCSPSAGDVEAAGVREYFHIIHFTTLLFKNPRV